MDTRKDLIARGIIQPAICLGNYRAEVKTDSAKKQKQNQAARAEECRRLKDLRNSNRSSK